MHPDSQTEPHSGLFASLCKKLGIDVSQDQKPDIFALAKEGIRDVPVAKDPSLKGDQHRTGLHAMIGPFPMDDFDRALILTAGEGVTEPRCSAINPKHVLAQAWDSNRFAGAKKRVDKSPEDFPISVTGYRFPGMPEFYGVTDGMHRSVAARLAGKETIAAEISGYWVCDPTLVEITHGVVLRKGRDNAWAQAESKNVLEILCALGVEEAPSLSQKLFKPLVNSLQKLG